MERIREINADLIVEQVRTIGSAPLLVLGQDGMLYYAKTTTLNTPRVELINELICAYMCFCWDILVPDFSLMRIDYALVKQFESDKGSLDGRYREESFNDLFFASKRLETAVELEGYINLGGKKSDLRPFRNALDIIKIGVFDLWIGNKDRKPENPNVLISDNGDSIDFYAIDHTASFSHVTNYKMVTEIGLFMEEKNRILNAPLVKSIAGFASGSDKANLRNEIIEGINEVNNNIDFIFEQVPKEWGFSKKAKEHLKTFLGNAERNEKISSSYLQYLR